VSRWRRIRNRLYQEICRRGFHRSLGSFVQSYGRERWTRHRS
jgi:GH15 family glucan-1,4-alpha-glucosidase